MIVLIVASIMESVVLLGMSSAIDGSTEALHRDFYEVTLVVDSAVTNPYFDAPEVLFTRPDATTVVTEAFFDGFEDGKAIYRARAYCDQTGDWSWTSGTHGGNFTVEASNLPGKLRIHPEDPYQFAYDNGTWFLHIGDTGYRYVVDTEPEWQAYIDQAVLMGATKIRTWFCQSRSGVEALFTSDRDALNLPYWQEIDKRLQYALKQHPHVIFQLIPYGEDGQELKRYAEGDAMSQLVARYAQARFSALPNVTWCVANDQILLEDGASPDRRGVPMSIIDRIGHDMAAREAWATLLTSHQSRFSGYAFTNASWSDITTLEDLDQVTGALLLEYRDKAKKPVVNDEDRYELYRQPEHTPYFFRRLMWASLLSGGHATYGGGRTYEPYNGKDRGVRGYFDLKNEGIIQGGADHFEHIHKFFKDTSNTLVGLRPSDEIAGNDPLIAKVIAGDDVMIVYLANPDNEEPGKANAAMVNATCVVEFPPGTWHLRWFNPQTGEWLDNDDLQITGGESYTCVAPFTQDAILYATRSE